MATRRTKAKPHIKFTFWKKDGELYFADREDLLKEIEKCGNSDEVIRKRMGHGYKHLTDALEGKRLTGWEASHIEWGLAAPQEYPPQNIRY